MSEATLLPFRLRLDAFRVDAESLDRKVRHLEHQAMGAELNRFRDALSEGFRLKRSRRPVHEGPEGSAA